MITNEEQIIIDAIRKGQTAAYSKLVDQYKNLVYTLALRMLKHKEEAEEVAQDAFVKIYKSLPKFKGDSKLSTWVYKVTYNCCLDRLKKNRKFLNDVPIDEYTYNRVEIIDNALEQLIKEERQEMIRACVGKLPEDSSALITLFYFDELTLEEISKITDIEANTVKVKLFRARKRLVKILEQTMMLDNNLSYGT